jgi:diaminohydroxyphosphoribosylaminopyrimidine deaminase / 5-amino-6-(5-phosphoribosylamino)uracil reductase
MATVFRITHAADWDAAQASGELAWGDLDRADGFLHCSAGHQVLETLAAHFPAQAGLVVLHVDTRRLPAAALRWEPSRGGELFPHLYAPLPTSAVTCATSVPADGAARSGLVFEDGGAHLAAQDRAHMARAIALALPGVGHTAENPSVGCVIARGGRVLAEAATARGGRPHAEEQALGLLGGELQGATAYVTLEPCGSRSSGSPSCSMLLAERRIGRVVVACRDPSPYAAGHGVTRLQQANILVEVGLMAEEAERALYGAYFARLTGR